MMQRPYRCLAVTGATASGKTALAILLAKALDGEIISCDSMQIYRGMDIGTAKATAEERAAVPHHLIDILAPTESFSAAEYAARAEEAVEAISARGRVPIFCGGTGLYLEAVRTDRHGTPIATDDAYRASLLRMAEEHGPAYLHARLQEVDPATAEAVHENNVRRVARALEVYHATGIPKSVLDAQASRENPRISILNFFLDFSDRALLYRRIDERVEWMAREGLFEETERLWREGLLLPGTTAAAAIGYKECLGAVRGEMSREEALSCLKNATHHYAKRQRTWFCAKEHVRIQADEDGRVRPSEQILSDILLPARAFLGRAD